MKVIAMLLTAIIAFFSWIASPFLPDKPERTDFIVDGKYWGFSTSEKTMSNFLKLTEAEDADTIYEIFSPAAREEAENLKDKIPEVIEFFNEDMTSWKSTTGYGEMDSVDGLIMKDSWDYLIYTDDVNYCCSISNTRTDINNSDNEGFYSIAIYPEYYNKDCSGYGYDQAGIFIFYPPDKQYNENIMEKIISQTNIYDLFCDTAKTESLNEQIKTFKEFLNENLVSWEFQDYITSKDNISNVIKRELMFKLNTKDVIYRCNVRDITKENGENLGIYSIAMYPEELYSEYSRLGYDETGIFHKKLTIKPDKDILDGGGIVTLTTSLEATVTCDRKYIELTQKDAYTWQAVIPNQLSVFDFTATTKDESVTCKVTSYSKDSDTE